MNYEVTIIEKRMAIMRIENAESKEEARRLAQEEYNMNYFETDLIDVTYIAEETTEDSYYGR